MALEVDDVRLHEDSAAVAEARHRLRREGEAGVVADVVAKARRGALEEVAVAGRALGVELEVFDLAVLQDDDLDVLAADVADDVDVVVEVERALTVGDGLDDRRVGPEHVVEDVLGVAGRADAEDLELAALRLDLLPEIGEELLGVDDRVALGELVDLAEDLAALAEENRLRGGRAAVDADVGADRRLGGEGLGLEARRLVLLEEALELLGGLREAGPPRLLLLDELALGQVPLELLRAGVDADVIVLGLAVLDRADRRVVLGVVRDEDQIRRVVAGRELDAALLPDRRDVGLPALDHALDVGVRPAEEEDVGHQRMTAGQDREVLLDDRLEERGHQLVRGDAELLQAVDVGLREDAALARDGVELVPVIGLLTEQVRGDLELGVDLVDHRPGPAGALVVHRRDLLLATALGVLLEDDDLRVLPAQLDHRHHLGVLLLDREGDRVDLLDELRADPAPDVGAARAGHEEPRVALLKAGHLSLHLLEHHHRPERLLGVVPLVILPDDLIRFGVADDRLDGGRAKIKTGEELVLRHGDSPASRRL